jgi:hypothetical protein
MASRQLDYRLARNPGLQQALLAAAGQGEPAAAGRDWAPADVRADMDEVCDGLVGTLEELRDLSRGLHPAVPRSSAAR